MTPSPVRLLRNSLVWQKHRGLIGGPSYNGGNAGRLPGRGLPELPENGVQRRPVRVEMVKQKPRPASKGQTGHAVATKWAWVELNYRPHAYQACALTT
jgi:hypothetical protein